MLSEKPWKPDAVLLLISGVLCTMAAGWFVQFAVQNLLPTPARWNPQILSFVINTVSFQGVTIALLTIFLRHHQMGWAEFLGGPSPARWIRAVGWGLAVGVMVLPFALGLNQLSMYLITLVDVRPEMQAPIKILQVSVTFWQRAAFAVAAIILAPLVEESLFRGILYPLIKQLGYPKVALWSSSLFFAFIHFNLMTFVPLTFLALVLAALYEKTDRLIASMAAHATFNVANFFILIYEAPISRWLAKVLRVIHF